MIAVQSAAVLLLALAAAAAMRRRSASLRHAALASGFAIACALPLLGRFAPSWQLPIGSPMAMLSQATSDEADRVRWLWYAGSSAGLLMIATGLARLGWIRAAARAVDDHRQAIADEVSAEFDVRRPVAFLETGRTMMPMTWGVLRPEVLLPFAARQWSDETLRAILRHEVAHVRRGDWAVQLLAALATRAFWFNPLTWIASRRLRLESERACDDAVLNLGVNGPDYAAHLVHAARTIKGSRTAGVAPCAAGAAGFEQRISAALDTTIDRTPLNACWCTLLAALLTLAALPIAGYGQPDRHNGPSLLDVQRDVLRRFGGEERRISIVANDISFRRSRLEGRVELQARLNVDGSVDGVRIVEPVHPDLANAAQAIVRQWRREPARVRGVAVEIPIRMTVDFRR